MQDAKTFARLVKGMRDAQNRFFKGDRSAEAVRYARDFERRVDKALDEILRPDREPSLFDPRD